MCNLRKYCVLFPHPHRESWTCLQSRFVFNIMAQSCIALHSYYRLNYFTLKAWIEILRSRSDNTRGRTDSWLCPLCFAVTEGRRSRAHRSLRDAETVITMPVFLFFLLGKYWGLGNFP